jgi:hypothetical protein
MLAIVRSLFYRGIPQLTVMLVTDDLEYCGPDSEEQNLTIEDATLKYKTECRICPFVTCEVMAYLREDTDVELTCWVPEGQLIIDDP